MLINHLILAHKGSGVRGLCSHFHSVSLLIIVLLLQEEVCILSNAQNYFMLFSILIKGHHIVGISLYQIVVARPVAEIYSCQMPLIGFIAMSQLIYCLFSLLSLLLLS